MKKPKFLQRYLDKRDIKKMKKLRNTPEFQIEQLNSTLKRQEERLGEVKTKLSVLEAEKRLKVLEEEAKEKERTDPYKADQWKVVYDPQHKLSTVYFNGQELYGAREFHVDFDGTQLGDYKQIPIISYEGHGSVEIITESE